MALSRSTKLLLLLPCPAMVCLSASLEDVVASSQCLPSAEAVRQEYPGAWASWSMHEPDHKGVRCWFPVMRENHARRIEGPPRKNEASHKDEASRKDEASPRRDTAEHRRTKPVVENRLPDDTTPPASADEMNALGWSFRSRTTRIGATITFDWNAMAGVSFDDRFAAAFEVSSVSQPSVIQRMMDPVGAIP
ncbi:MAG TPA: hypothetical protein VKP67_28490 [Xanthobacteraceae bacterium]|nr:hypothetical protein [Xanthobacteraceae bacterium]